MKVLIRTTIVDDGRERINFVHYFPDMLTEDERLDGDIIESYHNPENREGYHAVSYFNRSSNEVEHEYLKNPPSKEEELEDLKRKQALMQTAIDDLIFGGML